jgi:hypothetical protein
MILPGPWSAVLEPLRPAFRRRRTFTLFTVLATGMVAQTGRRSVVGMLAGAQMAGAISFHAACRFFSQAVWDADRLGLLVARLIADRLLDPGAPVVAVADDTLFRRWGRKVHHAFWTHDGAAQGKRKIGRGNRWVIAGIAVKLPFCSSPVCLPVLFRLWAGKGTASPVELAGELMARIAAEFAGRPVHGVGDAAYHGRPLLVPGATWTTRLPANAALFALAPPRTGKRGRPALKGARLGKPQDLAASATWQQVTVSRYGRSQAADLAEAGCIWYGSFGNPPRPVRAGPGSRLSQTLRPGNVHRRRRLQRHQGGRAVRDRWSIEPSNATSKQQMGVGQARNRLPKAVERTVPFGMLTQSLVIIWYTLSGHHPDDVVIRRQAQPWYDAKTEPSFEDMLTKLRKALIAARFSAANPGQADPDILRDYALACAAAAA